MAKKKIFKPVSKSRGVKVGTKRGAYSKTLKAVTSEPLSDLEPIIKTELLKTTEPIRDVPKQEIETEPMSEIKTDAEIKTEIKELTETIETIETTEKEMDLISDEIKKEEIKTSVEFKSHEIIKEPVLNSFADKSGEDKFNSWMSEYESVSPEDLLKEESKRAEARELNQRKKEEESERVIRDANAELINGAMLIGFCDFIFPSAIKIVYKYLLKDPRAGKIKHTDVMLSSDQVESISDVSDAAAKIIFQKIHPFVIFTIMMTIMYATNFKIALEKVEEKN